MKRFRRLRTHETLRKMVRETTLNKSDLIMPIFVTTGTDVKEEIKTMPGIFHFSIDRLTDEIRDLERLGIHQVIVFGIPASKDACGTSAYAPDGIVQKAVRHIKELAPSMYVITDVCLCQYTDHGHCGVLDESGQVVNDATLDILSKVAVSHAEAGADMVAPSDMMDGRIGHMRAALDGAGFAYTPIMSYTLKYASSYYGPFRQAAHSAPQFGDRRSYQMDFHNKREAQEIAAYDSETGADILMVKPALAYLDHVARLRSATSKPLAVYNVSGEYAMIKSALLNGLVDEAIIYETLIAFKRAGADLIITYFAKEIAEKWEVYCDA